MDYREEIIQVLDDVCKKAYKDGYESAKEEYIKQESIGYSHGLHDAWECANKILNAVVPYDYWDIGSGNHISSVIKHYSASEAMQKIAEYEYKQKKERCKTCEYYEGGFDCHHFCEPYNFDNYKEKQEQQNKKCEDCFTEKLTKEKWASAKDCKECKHFTDTDEVHGYTPCGSCGADLRKFEAKQTDAIDMGVSMDNSAETVKRNFKKELQKIVHQKCIEINHYITGCDSPFGYVNVREVQEKLNEIGHILGCENDSSK